MGYRWQGPILLSAQPWPGVDSTPGVYRVRIFNTDGKPSPIRRALGVDTDGILDIGESNNLRKRLREFWGCARGKYYPHSAGIEYRKWKLDQHWPLEQLHFDFIHVREKADAEKLELRMIDNYRKQFYDRPPLNKSQGKRWKNL